MKFDGRKHTDTNISFTDTIRNTKERENCNRNNNNNK